MNLDPWKLWKRPRKAMRESLLLRYGAAVLLPVAAAFIIFLRPSFTEAPYFVFLGAIILSAATGGLAPAFLSIALSSLLLRLILGRPEWTIQYGDNSADLERMIGFVLLSLLLSSFVAGLRRERDLLQDSEERYRMLAEAAADAILVIDERGEIIYVNPVAERTFGGQAGSLLGLNLSRLLPDQAYRAQLEEMKRHLDSRKRAVIVQLPGVRPSGESLVVEMTLGACSHRGKRLFTAILRDLTDRRHQ